MNYIINIIKLLKPLYNFDFENNVQVFQQIIDKFIIKITENTGLFPKPCNFYIFTMNFRILQ